MKCCLSHGVTLADGMVNGFAFGFLFPDDQGAVLISGDQFVAVEAPTDCRDRGFMGL